MKMLIMYGMVTYRPNNTIILEQGTGQGAAWHHRIWEKQGQSPNGARVSIISTVPGNVTSEIVS